MKKIIVIFIFALLLSVGVSEFTDTTRNCATVYIDFGPLGDQSKSSVCIPIDTKTSALTVLKSAGYNLEGTKKYGNAIVCRVNGLPDVKSEKCLDMPPEKAYWAVIIKPKQLIPLPLNVGSPWGWAQTGINEIYLNPGDSIGLVFADNGKVIFP